MQTFMDVNVEVWRERYGLINDESKAYSKEQKDLSRVVSNVMGNFSFITVE